MAQAATRPSPPRRRDLLTSWSSSARQFCSSSGRRAPRLRMRWRVRRQASIASGSAQSAPACATTWTSLGSAPACSLRAAWSGESGPSLQRSRVQWRWQPSPWTPRSLCQSAGRRSSTWRSTRARPRCSASSSSPWTRGWMRGSSSPMATKTPSPAAAASTARAAGPRASSRGQLTAASPAEASLAAPSDELDLPGRQIRISGREPTP
mmetsp:Transcript_750/g.2400  ORF Transcript_750/g.2400 Transcript_750/m.2400 type:complete len:208 (+) Transcript_750:340-963(+)